MVEIQNNQIEFRASIGKELKEDRVKIQSPSLYKEIQNNIERIEKYGSSSNKFN